MAAVDDALAGVFERLPVFDQVPGAFEIGGEYYVAASVVGDGKVAISLTCRCKLHEIATRRGVLGLSFHVKSSQILVKLQARKKAPPLVVWSFGPHSSKGQRSLVF